MDNNINKQQKALAELKLLQVRSITKKTLWETEIISQDDAAFLLDISKETLRERGNIFKQLRQGNKIYYHTKQLREALTDVSKFNSNAVSTTEVLFSNYI
jgi:hypothetical protein